MVPLQEVASSIVKKETMERLQVFNLVLYPCSCTIFTINHTVPYTCNMCNITNQDFQRLKQVFIAYYVPTAFDLHVMIQIATAIDGTVIITVSVVLVTTILVLILLISCCCCCYYCLKKKSERKRYLKYCLYLRMLAA